MSRFGLRASAIVVLLLGAAMIAPALPATPAAAGRPPNITSSVALDPNPTTPGSTSTATFTFRADGPASFRVGGGLLGTNGNGTFTDNGQVPELTNCAMDSTLRAFSCDWNPTGPNEEVKLTLQINVSPETPDGEEFDVGSGIGNRFDEFEELLIRAPTTTTTTTSTSTSTTTTTTPASTTTTSGPAAADAGEARLSPTG